MFKTTYLVCVEQNNYLLLKYRHENVSLGMSKSMYMSVCNVMNVDFHISRVLMIWEPFDFCNGII